MILRTRLAPITPSGPISRKVLDAVKRAARHGTSPERQAALKQIIKDLRTAGQAGTQKRIDPAFGLYQRGLQVVANLSGSLTHFEEFHPFVDLQEQAEEVFSFDGPPTTPVTESFSSSWSWFDAWIGSKRETRGTVILDVVRALGLAPELLQLVENLVRSRMGVYTVTEVDGKLTYLRELVTEEVHNCFVPAGYPGQPGELWFVRVVPPPPGLAYGITLTTPYVLRSADSDDWEDFLRRTARKVKAPKGVDRIVALLKYGIDRSYWFNFIEDAYVSNRKEVLFLAGTPEAPDGGPWTNHSDAVTLPDRMREVAKELSRRLRAGKDR